MLKKMERIIAQVKYVHTSALNHGAAVGEHKYNITEERTPTALKHNPVSIASTNTV